MKNNFNCNKCSKENNYMYKCDSCKMVFCWDCVHFFRSCENIDDDAYNANSIIIIKNIKTR